MTQKAFTEKQGKGVDGREGEKGGRGGERKENFAE